MLRQCKDLEERGEGKGTHWVQGFLDCAGYACCGAQDFEFVAVVGDEGDVFGGFVHCCDCEVRWVG